MNAFNRRDFLKGCCVTALAAGPGSRARAWFAPPDLLPAAATEDTLVVVFLRGAMDGLSLLPPGASSPYRADYEAARTNTRVPVSGAGAALALANTTWALHPRATGLHALYQAGHAAFVVAAGQMQPNPVVRSHFEAQSNLEFGVGGGSGNGIGWLTRHLVSGGLPANVPLPAVSMGSITASSLLGSSDAITMNSGSDFRLDTFHWSWQDDDAAHGIVGAVGRMNALWSGSTTQLERAGRETLDSLALLRPIDFNPWDATNHPNGYQPTGGANYTLAYNSGFGAQLRNVAQMIKLNLGLRAVTIDLGNWDTHVGQGNPTQSYDWFGNQVESLSQGLSAFYTDLSTAAQGNLMQRVSVIVVSEFGRRVLENADGGTDHGYGNVITVLGGTVNGAHVYGTFPGLATAQLYEGTDVAVTTDYRRVISEALIRRMGNPNIYYAFPGYSGYAPLGIFQGSDLPPTGYDQIFGNGFDAA
ncbi:DUF1501 domain-containing protein [Dokdonella fugitiva]|jgi:uncharacterized protein (DUF1501 family)|uniref:Secreted protein n=1 Tax=Dokdonella fugitiva TaxID=328517 RepID=A0A4R2I8V6_9GAMM|nr:DUF1501 domain-containing protein [Dokdonella fugitiva]MBA8884814.1 uncharacterized protein (DUF1501 family) [Dokdonella fugitiva]TCO40831.1 secreted protein [Dokdonella fugitiva]